VCIEPGRNVVEFFSLHWDLCKVCIEPKRKRRESELSNSLTCKECMRDWSLNQINAQEE
jgi:hypothetical protein